MSAPESVRTKDGVVWTLRTVTSSGIALYAPKGVCECPAFVMATLSELAEHGIQSAELAEAVAEYGAFPVPVGRGSVPLSGPICSQSAARAAGLDVAPSVAELDAMAESVVALGDPLSAEVSLAQAVPLLTAAVTGLRSQVAALLEERHSTNESVSEAAETLRVQRDRIAALETGPALPWAHVMPDGDLHGFLDGLVSAAMGRWRSGPEVPDRTVLADIERVCREWRTPGEGYRSDPESEVVPAPIQAVGFFDGVPVSPPSERPVAALRELSSREEPHDSPLSRPYLFGRDMPEAGGTR